MNFGVMQYGDNVIVFCFRQIYFAIVDSSTFSIRDAYLYILYIRICLRYMYGPRFRMPKSVSSKTNFHIFTLSSFIICAIFGHCIENIVIIRLGIKSWQCLSLPLSLSLFHMHLSHVCVCAPFTIPICIMCVERMCAFYSGGECAINCASDMAFYADSIPFCSHF